MKLIKIFFYVLVVLFLALVVTFGVLYAGRVRTVAGIEQLTDYEDGHNLYSMHLKYDYDLGNILKGEIKSDDDYTNALLAEVFPYLPIEIESPKFGCSAFSMETPEGGQLMGRNYDFSRDTSAMLVYCEPKGGYKSVSFADLNNVKVQNPYANLKSRLSCLAAPFAVLDGMNEKGVSIAVLALDSDPVRQDTGKTDIATTIAIRLVLDKAASTQEAISLLRQYDMFACGGLDYHFYITDASGDACVVEYDPCDETRPIVVTPKQACTNFYVIYEDQVLPNQKNGIYGHGKERYQAIAEILQKNADCCSKETAWEALQAAAQTPKPDSITSNTQWSIVFDNTDLTAQIVIRRNWEDVVDYDLKTNTIMKTNSITK